MAADLASAAPRRILVVRLGSMGDVIHTLPAVATLRQAFPEAQIGWAIEPRWAALLRAQGAGVTPRSEQQPLVDFVHLVDTRGWRKTPASGATWQEMRAVLRVVREQRYQVAVDFQGAWKSAAVASLSGAPRRLGFRRPRERPASLFYTRAVPATGAHIVEQNLSLAHELCPGTPPELHFALPHDPAAAKACAQELEHRGLRRFAILSPGTGWGAKSWPAERYGAVARALADSGLPSLVNYGPGEEDLARQVEDAGGGGARLFPASLAELMELTRRASLFVAGDTGPMHLAAALRVPVVAIFGPTDPARNGPFGAPSVVLRSPLSPTTHTRRARPDPGLLTISADQVIAAAQRLLKDTGGAHG
jgi:heptosyltransferase-1